MERLEEGDGLEGLCVNGKIIRGNGKCVQSERVMAPSCSHNIQSTSAILTMMVAKLIIGKFVTLVVILTMVTLVNVAAIGPLVT